jgi:hypothetical protein
MHLVEPKEHGIYCEGGTLCIIYEMPKEKGYIIIMEY